MIKIIQGDITTLAVDAIINAARRAEREVRKFLSHTEAWRGGGPRTPALMAFASRTTCGWEIPVATSDGSDLLLFFRAGCSGV